MFYEFVGYSTFRTSKFTVCSVISITGIVIPVTREIDGNCIIRSMKSDNNGNDGSFGKMYFNRK